MCCAGCEATRVGVCLMSVNSFRYVCAWVGRENREIENERERGGKGERKN